MPRGKQKSVSERLEILDSEISEMEDRKSKINTKLKNLEDQKQELLKELKLEQASKLLEALKAAGKTPEDITAMLQNDSTEST